eukprot:TRINITY_DN3371_c0_g1_i4.p1 TRINITY_DN3371_c0_g1~~TRINITY_DN3371_c0_g1_i4.p1  ORF type:complete len:124 (+),score=32.80 TRINITY_DN3371_c0_g1_i4:118-489(+)
MSHEWNTNNTKEGLKCMNAWEGFWDCCRARNQFTFYYRFGEFEACLKKFSGWSECIKMKSWSEREVSEYLNAKYPQKVEEKTAHPVFGPFRTHPPPMWALEQKEKEQEVNVNPSLGDVLNKKM